jgi:ABC-type multidrug transport system ATPase subunit
VISHDHRFLDNVTTHILDVDYESVLLYHGDYTTFLESKQAERQRREKGIAAREREIAHHQKFVDRFRAKASKARQAQSKVRMIEKKAEGLIELAPSSRRYPTFRFEQVRDSGRDVLKIKGVKKAFGDNRVLQGVDLLVQRGERLAIMGPNGIGKSTLLKIVMGELDADEGQVEWGYETHPAYFAQDHREEFDPPHNTAEGWVWDSCSDRDIGYVRARMALMLFSGDDSKKRLSALSGGEAARLVFTRLAIARPNVLVLDEPTNHLDLESIEALVEGLKAFPGTLIIVSHDRWFVSRLATRIVEIKPEEVRDYHGTYEEYVHFCGDDHLDADRVILKAKTEKRKKTEGKEKTERPRRKEKGSGTRTGTGAGTGTRTDSAVDPVLARGNGRRAAPASGVSKARKKQLLKRQEQLTASIEEAEARVAEIDEVFCEPTYYERTSAGEVKILETERTSLQNEVAELTSEWERTEEEIG